MQCSESDSYLIMDDNNSAPRLLSRPGEAIYNDAAGMLEGNSPFQVVWQAESERMEALTEQIETTTEQVEAPDNQLEALAESMFDNRASTGGDRQ